MANRTSHFGSPPRGNSNPVLTWFPCTFWKQILLAMCLLGKDVKVFTSVSLYDSIFQDWIIYRTFPSTLTDLGPAFLQRDRTEIRGSIPIYLADHAYLAVSWLGPSGVQCCLQHIS